MAAGSVLVGCLVILALQSAAAAHSSAYLLASAATAAVLSPNVYPLIPGALSLVRDPETSTGAWVFLVILASFLVSSILLICNVVFWRDAWPLIVTFSIQLTYGLFLFARMLTVRQ